MPHGSGNSRRSGPSSGSGLFTAVESRKGEKLNFVLQNRFASFSMVGRFNRKQIVRENIGGAA